METGSMKIESAGAASASNKIANNRAPNVARSRSGCELIHGTTPFVAEAISLIFQLGG